MDDAFRRLPFLIRSCLQRDLLSIESITGRVEAAIDDGAVNWSHLEAAGKKAVATSVVDKCGLAAVERVEIVEGELVIGGTYGVQVMATVDDGTSGPDEVTLGWELSLHIPDATKKEADFTKVEVWAKD